jgi:hypothetical protein
LEGRKAKCVAYLEAELLKFKTDMDSLDKYADLGTFPVSWEIRSDIEKAILDLISGIRSTAKEDRL